VLLTLRHPPLQFAVLILFCEFPRDSTFSRQRFGLINRIIRAVVRKIKFLFYLPTGGNKSFWSVGRTFLSARFLERGVDIPVCPFSGAWSRHSCLPGICPDEQGREECLRVTCPDEEGRQECLRVTCPDEEGRQECLPLVFGH